MTSQRTDAHNTLVGGLTCPFCQAEIISGVGFRLGAVSSKCYEVGDEIGWEGDFCRPESRPDAKVIKTLGYYNCDNVHCSSWQDCYPDVQLALITVENNIIKSVETYTGPSPEGYFPILEPADLVHL